MRITATFASLIDFLSLWGVHLVLLSVAVETSVLAETQTVCRSKAGVAGKIIRTHIKPLDWA